jgi:curved DNA-binding protein CbpA
MKDVNSAYSVLKDPNQRRHYDANRDAILRGDDDFSCSDMSDDHPSPTHLYKYFYSGCYHGYGDDANGFYAVYRNLFEQLNTHEKHAAEVDPTGQYATGGRRKMGKFKEGPTFGSSSSSNDEVFAFYEYWKSFESRMSFDWVSPHDMDAMMYMMMGGMYDIDPFYISATARREYTRSVTDLIDYLDRCDPRLSAAREEYKEQRKAAKRNARLKKYGSDGNQKESGEDDALALEQLRNRAAEWAEGLLRQSGGGSVQGMSKAEKEKLRKAQSKVRNTFKKLLRLAASDPNAAEYGVYSVEDVETICANCSVDDIVIANEVMGGEGACKDPTLFMTEAVEGAIRPLIEASTANARAIEEDVIMSRTVRQKRVQQQQQQQQQHPPVPPGTKSCEWWSESERVLLLAGLDRYPPVASPYTHVAQLETVPTSSVSRWQMVANFVNYQRLELQNSGDASINVEFLQLFSDEDVLIEAYKASTQTANDS